MKAVIKPQQAGSIDASELADNFVKYSGYRFADLPTAWGSDEVMRQALAGAVKAPGAEGQYAQDLAQILNEQQINPEDVVRQVYNRVAPAASQYQAQSKVQKNALMGYAKQIGKPVDEAGLRQLADDFRQGKTTDPIAFAAAAVYNPLSYSSGRFRIPEDEINRIYQDNPGLGNDYLQKLRDVQDWIDVEARSEYQKKTGLLETILPVTGYRAAQASPDGQLLPEDEQLLTASAPYNTPEAMQAKREELQRLRDPGVLEYAGAGLTDIIGLAGERPGAAIGGMLSPGPEGQAMGAFFAAPEGLGAPENQRIGWREQAGGTIGSATSVVPIPGISTAGRLPSAAGRVATELGVTGLKAGMNTRAGQGVLNLMAKRLNNPEALRNFEETLSYMFTKGAPNVDELAEIAANYEKGYASAISQGRSPAEAAVAARQTIEFSPTVRAGRVTQDAIGGGVTGAAYSLADEKQGAGDVIAAAGMGAAVGSAVGAGREKFFGSHNPIQQGVQHPAFAQNTIAPATYQRRVNAGEISPAVSDRLQGQAFDEAAGSLDKVMAEYRNAASEQFVEGMHDIKSGGSNITGKQIVDQLYRPSGSIDGQPGFISETTRGNLMQRQADRGELADVSKSTPDPAMSGLSTMQTTKEQGIPMSVLPDRGRGIVSDVLAPGVLPEGTPPIKTLRDAITRVRQSSAKQSGGVVNNPNNRLDQLEKTFDTAAQKLNAITKPGAKQAFIESMVETRKGQGSSELSKMQKLTEDVEEFLAANPGVKNAEAYRALADDAKSAVERFKKVVNETGDFRKAWEDYAKFVNTRAVRWAPELLQPGKELPMVQRIADMLDVTITTELSQRGAQELDERDIKSAQPNLTPIRE